MLLRVIDAILNATRPYPCTSLIRYGLTKAADAHFKNLYVSRVDKCCLSWAQEQRTVNVVVIIQNVMLLWQHLNIVAFVYRQKKIVRVTLNRVDFVILLMKVFYDSNLTKWKYIRSTLWSSILLVYLHLKTSHLIANISSYFGMQHKTHVYETFLLWTIGR